MLIESIRISSNLVPSAPPHIIKHTRNNRSKAKGTDEDNGAGEPELMGGMRTRDQVSTKHERTSPVDVQAQPSLAELHSPKADSRTGCTLGRISGPGQAIGREWIWGGCRFLRLLGTVSVLLL